MHTSGHNVAACVSGEMRSLLKPFVGARITKQLLVPLHTDTYVFVKTSHAIHEGMYNSIHVALSGANILNVSVTPVERGVTPPCGGNGHGGGYFQTLELMKCYKSMMRTERQYQWALRLRTDLLTHVSIPVFPSTMPFDNMAFVSTLAGCDCGWSTTRSCVHNSRCACVGDGFAVLYGQRAIRAYLHGFGDMFCRRRAQSPECRLGYALNAHNVTLRDIRFIRAQFADTRQMHCSVSSAMAPAVSMDAWRWVPYGPWDDRRYPTCAHPRAHNFSLCMFPPYQRRAPHLPHHSCVV